MFVDGMNLRCLPTRVIILVIGGATLGTTAKNAAKAANAKGRLCAFIHRGGKPVGKVGENRLVMSVAKIAKKVLLSEAQASA